MLLRPGDMTSFVRIERPVADASLDGAGSGAWQEVASVYASVQDMLPSRGERLADGINVASRPAQVRIYYRDDVTAAMRFVLMKWDGTAWAPTARLMEIVAGPAELGWREGLEFMVIDYSTAGNAA